MTTTPMYTNAIQRFFSFIQVEILRFAANKRLLLVFILLLLDGILMMHWDPRNTGSNALDSLLLSIMPLGFLVLAFTALPAIDFSSRSDATFRTFFRYPATYVSARLIVICIDSFVLSVCYLGVDFLVFFYLFPPSSSVKNYLFPLSGKIFVAAIIIFICVSVGITAAVLVLKNRFIGLGVYMALFILVPWIIGLFFPLQIAEKFVPLLIALNLLIPQTPSPFWNALYWQNIGIFIGWTILFIALCLLAISLLPNLQAPRFIQNIANSNSKMSKFLR